MRGATWIICCSITLGYLAMLAESMIREIAFENGIAAARIDQVMNGFLIFDLPSLIAWPAMAILMMVYRREVLRRTKNVQLKLA